MIHGTPYYGEVDRVDGEYLITRFFHVCGLPLVPLRSIWVTHEQGTQRFGHDCRLSGRSVVAAYARTWTLVAWPLALASATFVASGVVGLAVTPWAARWRRLRDPGRHRQARLEYRLRCGCVPSEAIAVWSIGPNGIDEGGEGDDLASWR